MVGMPHPSASPNVTARSRVERKILRSALLAATLGAASPFALATEPLSAHGIDLGMSSADFFAKPGRAFKCYPSDGTGLLCGLDRRGAGAAGGPFGRYGPVRTRQVLVTVSNGVVSRVAIAYERPEDYDELVAALTRRHGPPTAQGDSAMRGPSGGPLLQRTAVWERDGRSLVARKYGARFDEGSIVLSAQGGAGTQPRRAIGAGEAVPSFISPHRLP